MPNDASQPTRRAVSADVAAARRALSVIRPFVGKFEDWNNEAARHSANMLSSFTDLEQKRGALAALENLRSEVSSDYARFSAAAKNIQHSRIDDIRHSFARLLKTLDEALA